MKDENLPHGHSHSNHEVNDRGGVIEGFKEEGMLTIETLDIASQNAKTHSIKNKGGKITVETAILLNAFIIGLSIIICGFIIQNKGVSGRVVNDQPVGVAQATTFAGKAIDNMDYVDGKASSDVVVIEYSDPECPFCIQLHPVMEKLRADYSNKVAFVYRAFPLTSLHPKAFDESKAIYCAGVVGGKAKYYQYVDALYGYKVTKQNQANASPALSATGKEDLARQVGLSLPAFNGCMSDQKTTDAINNSLADGAAAGVQGTPSTFILVKNGSGYDQIAMIDGARQESFFKAAIEQALKK